MCDDLNNSEYYNDNNNDVLSIEDITGTLGKWLEMDTSDIDSEIIIALSSMYKMAVNKL